MLAPTTPSSGVTTVASAKLQQLLGDLCKLPLLPGVAQQAMALADEKNASVQDLCELLEKDVTLASSILKLANSPMYNWGQPVARLDQAVVRLGLRECQNLILAVCMRNVFRQANPVANALCAVLWNHCFLTGCLCRRLNRELRLGFQGEEFPAGLLHDLGRILLAVSVPQQFEAADPMDFDETPEILERENDILETDHCHLGAHYAKQNNLPSAVASAIRYHHQTEADRENRTLINLVAAADHMANHLQRQEDPDSYDVSLNPAFTILSEDWSSERKTAFAKRLPQLLTEIAKTAIRQPKFNSDSGVRVQGHQAFKQS